MALISLKMQAHRRNNNNNKFICVITNGHRQESSEGLIVTGGRFLTAGAAIEKATLTFGFWNKTLFAVGPYDIRQMCHINFLSRVQ